MMKNGKASTPNPNLQDFWLEPARFRVLYGGRDSSKSWDAATRAAWIAHKIKVRVLCTRMYQNRIEESVYTTIKKQIRRFHLDRHFTIQHNKILSDKGSEFLFYGLARNIQEIKSLEGVDILWLEEAQSLTEEMWEILEPTIRKEGSEIWIVFNPHLATDFAWKRFVEDPPENAVVRKINYDGNPFLSDTSKETIERIKEEDYSSYEHIYEGIPREDDDAVIIKRGWIEACVDAHKKLNIPIVGTNRVGYDVADSGDDSNAVTARYGVLITDTDLWSGGEDELMKSTKRAYNWATKTAADIYYDSIGVGAGVGSKVNEINEESGRNIEHVPFNAGSKVVDPEKEYMPKVKNKDHFSNLKAQSWWLVADRFRDTYNAITKDESIEGKQLISISSECSNLQTLITELSSPKRDYDSAGRVKVESKKDMQKRGIKSPNLADSSIMAFAPTTKPKGSLSPQVLNI